METLLIAREITSLDRSMQFSHYNIVNLNHKLFLHFHGNNMQITQAVIEF